MAQTATVLRVDDLVSTASLNVRVLAGEGGLGREVLWAHSCELSDPTRWLGPHELLMTVGLCIPSEPSAQAQFVQQLDDAGLAGLMIGDHEVCPPISERMLEEAARRQFPLLLAATETPYAAVARHVAAANTSSQIMQVLKLSKLYQVTANADDDTDALVRSLGSLLHVGLRVEERRTGLPILEYEAGSATEAELTTRRYPLQGVHQSDLLISEFPDEPLDSFVLVHLRKVLEVTVDRIISAADRRAEVSARVLGGLLNGTKPHETDHLLAPHRASEGFQIAAFSSENGPLVARAVALREIPLIVGAGRTCHLALMPVAVAPQLRALGEPRNVQFGVSSVFSDHADVAVASQEAEKVLAASQQSGRLWTEFEGITISVLARSHREAEGIIGGVLGPLAEDTAAAVRLRETLFAYLRNDRQWRETADDLGIHRQSLAYRLKRIEELTGLSVTKSSDLSAFWIASQAWNVVRA